MTSIKATYVANQKSSKVFEVPVTSSSLVDSIQTIQNDINKFLTNVMEEEKKQGIKQPEIKEEEEEDDEEMKEEEEEEEEEDDDDDEKAQALKKQKLEA
ncbi:hypothetical protein K501DRAFT_282521 [Backusella circina FSU 941]|nr:hypothetical protein K501DRAFT_282521 [Backusella circina FSU 941]